MSIFRGIAGLPSALPTRAGDAQLQQATFVPAVDNPTYADQLKQYEELIAQGVTSRDAWAQTGIYAGPATGDVPVAEIDDSTAGFPGGELPTTGDTTYSPLGESFNHPELFEYDPTLADINLRVDGLSGTAEGSYREGDLANAERIRLGVDNGADRARSVLLHELQHAAQQRNSEMPGGMSPRRLNEYGVGQYLAEAFPNYMDLVPEERRLTEEQLAYIAENPDMTTDDVYAYFFSPGEALARATQERRDLSAAERLEVFPEDSLDTPNEGLAAYIRSVFQSGMP
tara:strand:+ start:69 stop:923 length:855 start_codon:yes stop_codon:yes gene_type:complete